MRGAVRKTNEKFQEEAKIKNQKVTVVGKYVGSNKKVRCLICLLAQFLKAVGVKAVQREKECLLTVDSIMRMSQNYFVNVDISL